MATAYAALVSLMQIIKQTKQHPFSPISLDPTQVKDLTKKISFLQEFLERYSHRSGRNELESGIADVAHKAADIIESCIVDWILAGSTSSQQYSYLFDGLRRVINNMDFIMERVQMNTEESGSNPAQPQPAARPPNLQRPEHNITIGLDDDMRDILDQLTSTNSDRLILPIVGMAGIGKTTLARNVYSHKLTLERFDILAWTTVSQEYSTLEILRDLHSQFNISGGDDNTETTVDEDKLGSRLYQFLCGKRYIIILDDVWNSDAWDKICDFLPSNGSGSRIIVTTRLLPVARHLSNCYLLQMSLLDGDKSWDLFSRVVFGEGRGCPLERREAAKKITEGCRGLPLSIVVIGGLLKKLNGGADWEYIAENFKTHFNLMDDELCSRILYMSYNELPIHLKPCFLYMGVFPEDEVIHVSMLIKLWVAEGFLKPIQGKSIEHVAQEYMSDLIDRNLVMVQKLGSTGNLKYCNVHDLLRELCLREAQREGFLKVIKKTSPIPDELVENNNNVFRIVIPERLSAEVDDYSAYARRARSLICISGEASPLDGFRLLRIWKTFDKDLYEEEEELSLPENLSDLVNLRYVAVTAQVGSEFLHSIFLLWNLQTLIVNQVWPNDRAFQIWLMPFIRHVKFSELELPDPPPLPNGYLTFIRHFLTPSFIYGYIHNPERLFLSFIRYFHDRSVTYADMLHPNPFHSFMQNLVDLSYMYDDIIQDSMRRNNVIVLENLQTLSKVKNFRFSKEVVERIPNIKKLIVFYNNLEGNSNYRFDNVKRLAKLESFGFFFFPSGPKLFGNLTFPNSLKKLTISHFHWDEMLGKIGALPLLEKLKLINGHMKQRTWETTEGQFCNLKFLRIDGCNVECWSTESGHFPRLKHLVLCNLEKLNAIPSEIGGIPTLESIRLEFCSSSSVASARRILEEQKEFGNEYIRVRVLVKEGNRRPRGAAIPNFQVEYIPN